MSRIPFAYKTTAEFCALRKNDEKKIFLPLYILPSHAPVTSLPLPGSVSLADFWMNRRLIKAISLFLLLWTAADLGVPGFCRTDGIHLPSFRGRHATVDKQTAPEPANQLADEDDCFCCCSHIIHTPYFALQPGSLTAFVELPDILSQPDSVSFPLFHPPRA